MVRASVISTLGKHFCFRGKWLRALASVAYVTGAGLLVPLSASAQDTSMISGLTEEADFKAYPIQDVASATLTACLTAVPGDPSIRKSLSELDWREISWTTTRERRVTALATFQLNQNISLNYTEANSLQLAWDRVVQTATRQANQPPVRNSPRQTIWFERDASDALLMVRTDKKERYPTTECDIAVTADIGATSIASRRQALAIKDLPPVVSVPMQWSTSGDATQLVYLTFFDTPVLENVISDGFDFIAHLGTKHFINRQVPS